MNQYLNDDDPDGQEDTGQQGDRSVTVSRRQLNNLEKKAREMEARASAAERKLAFAQAGIDLSDAKMKYFVNGYDGEITADSIKKAATEAGFLSEEAPPEPQQIGQQAQPNQPQVGQPMSPEQIQAQQLEAAQNPTLHQDSTVFGQIAQATSQQDTSGVNQRAAMEKILREGGTAYDLANYMRGQEGMYVAEEY